MHHRILKRETKTELNSILRIPIRSDPNRTERNRTEASSTVVRAAARRSFPFVSPPSFTRCTREHTRRARIRRTRRGALSRTPLRRAVALLRAEPNGRAIRSSSLFAFCSQFGCRVRAKTEKSRGVVVVPVVETAGRRSVRRGREGEWEIRSGTRAVFVSPATSPSTLSHVFRYSTTRRRAVRVAVSSFFFLSFARFNEYGGRGVQRPAAP